jgi:hypothetical protein
LKFFKAQVWLRYTSAFNKLKFLSIYLSIYLSTFSGFPNPNLNNPFNWSTAVVDIVDIEKHRKLTPSNSKTIGLAVGKTDTI